MIRCENLSKSFKRARVLDGIDLDIALGERIALIGSNGAGKTTLIRCLLGEYVHDGRVTIDGRSPRTERTAVLGSIGFVPQLPPPLKMPVGQLIEFSAALSGADPQQISAIADRLGLAVDGIRARPFIKLSGRLACRLIARRVDAALAKTLGTWKFASDDSGLVWTGEVAGPDRLRFIGMLSRYVALIADLSLTEKVGADGTAQ